MTYTEIWHALAPVYGSSEAKAVARLLLDDLFGFTLTDIVSGKVSELSAESTLLLQEKMRRLSEGEPVQYVTGQALFCGRSFSVGPGVLIPRPETEDLVALVERFLSAKAPDHLLRIVDGGTGSGCIACTLALDVPQSEVTAWDVSPAAIRRAQANAASLGAKVDIVHRDMLSLPTENSCWDVIVSNPPYVLESERADMERNVVGYEPQEALFVPDADALRFYRALATYAHTALRPGGLIAFEINPLCADAMKTLLEAMDFHSVTLSADRFGRTRFLSATS